MLKCHTCENGEYEELFFPSYFRTSSFIGSYIIKDVSLLRCNFCGDTLWDEKAMSLDNKARTDLEQKCILSRPLCEFITAKEAANILGMSIQALIKNHKANRKIFWIKRCGVRLYLEKSVRLFGETGNGLFYIGGVN